MKKGRKGKKIGSDTSHKVSLLANLSSSLILRDYMTTTKGKAKAFIPYVERVFTLARPADLNARRRINSLLRNDSATDKVFNVLLKRFGDTTSGLVSIYKLENRKGDNAQMVRLVLKGYEAPKKKTRVKEEKKVEKAPVEEKKEVKKEEKKAVKKDTKVDQKSAEAIKDQAKAEEPNRKVKRSIKGGAQKAPAEGPKQNESFFTKIFGFGKNKGPQKPSSQGRARSRSGI